MNLNEYNALRRVTDAVRAADSAFCEDFYNDEQLTEKTYELLKDLLDNLSDLYSISDMIIDNETYRRDAIRRDDALRVAYVEVLNGLISNGSAIAYLIRDYYI